MKLIATFTIFFFSFNFYSQNKSFYLSEDTDSDSINIVRTYFINDTLSFDNFKLLYQCSCIDRANIYTNKKTKPILNDALEKMYWVNTSFPNLVNKDSLRNYLMNSISDLDIEKIRRSLSEIDEHFYTGSNSFILCNELLKKEKLHQKYLDFINRKNIYEIIRNKSSRYKTEEIFTKNISLSKRFDDQTKDTLFRFCTEEYYEPGIKCGYINQKGDTVIPLGKYLHCYSDTILDFGIVGDKSKFYTIDQNEDYLFDIYWFDNGPDEEHEGLYRVKKNEKIGYANKKGEIIIEPQFECAYPFENGKAKVTFKCILKQQNEHKTMISEEWFYINRTGEIVPE